MEILEGPPHLFILDKMFFSQMGWLNSPIIDPSISFLCYLRTLNACNVLDHLVSKSYWDGVPGRNGVLCMFTRLCHKNDSCHITQQQHISVHVGV